MAEASSELRVDPVFLSMTRPPMALGVTFSSQSGRVCNSPVNARTQVARLTSQRVLHGGLRGWARDCWSTDQ
jgi:hypothetical protein